MLALVVKRYWKLIAIFVLLTGILSAGAYLHKKNIELEVANAELITDLELSQGAVEALEDDKARVGRVTIRNQQEKALVESELDKTQRKLEELVNESNDECLDRPLAANILDRL